jgi:hypothetical protein
MMRPEMEFLKRMSDNRPLHDCTKVISGAPRKREAPAADKWPAADGVVKGRSHEVA